MPELPEVETVVRKLEPVITGTYLCAAEQYDAKLKIAHKIPSGIVHAVSRKGKQIVLVLDQSFVAIHLRMSGRLFWVPNGLGDLSAEWPLYQKLFGIKSKKHIRSCFRFSHGALLFVDPRRFGTIVYAKDEADITPIGMEPLSKNFTQKCFDTLLEGVEQPIKLWLLRQDKIVGIGNIYACEILFKAGISPWVKACDLTIKQRQAVYRQIRAVLGNAIRNCGTTFSDFQSTHGEIGSFQKFLAVYHREGESCIVCQTIIKRVAQSGRSTFYCEKCQE